MMDGLPSTNDASGSSKPLAPHCWGSSRGGWLQNPANDNDDNSNDIHNNDNNNNNNNDNKAVGEADYKTL